jgi:HPt (histidine-containing phosphotransfer) domain-containing protein
MALVLDPDVLDTLRQLNEPGQPDVLAEVLRLFLDDAPRRIQAIVAAVADRDAGALQRAAHTMKGAAGTIGATALQDACRTLEQMGRQQRVEGASIAIADLQREYGRVQEAIEQLL